MKVKEIPSIPEYGASDCGLIFERSGVAWLEVKQRFSSPSKPNKKQYKIVDVVISGKTKTRFVHRLVLEAFVGPCPRGMQTRHLNDVGTDNRLENLKWGTPKENGEDKVSNKIQPWGEVHHKAVFTESQIIEMRRLWNSGATATELQKIFGGKIAAIHHACTGKNWRHVECEDPNTRPSIKPKDILTAFGETRTYSEWANDDRCSVASSAVIRARIKRGVPPEKAVADPPDELTEAFGESKLLKEWAQDSRCVVTYGTLLRRLKDGVDIETAITSEWCNIAPKKKAPNLKPDQVIEIKKRLANGENCIDIANSYGLSKSTISKIKTGANHAAVKETC